MAGVDVMRMESIIPDSQIKQNQLDAVTNATSANNGHGNLSNYPVSVRPSILSKINADRPGNPKIKVLTQVELAQMNMNPFKT